MVDQLQLLITVWDESQRNAKGDYIYYTQTMVKLLHQKDYENIHLTHEIVKVERWQELISFYLKILIN